MTELRALDGAGDFEPWELDLHGHTSLGGGVAMIFFWRFPERVERLALVSSGGLGREVSPLLRSAAVPGVRALLSLAAHPRLTGALHATGDGLQGRGANLGVQLQSVARALRPLETPGAREAFVQTLRAVIDARGQRVSAVLHPPDRGRPNPRPSKPLQLARRHTAGASRPAATAGASRRDPGANPRPAATPAGRPRARRPAARGS